jgi:hypothetical protein
MKRMTAGAAVLAVSLLTSAASASHVDVDDGNDTRSRLDVRRVAHSGSDFPKWKISTYNSWTRQQIWDQGYLTVFLDTFGTRRHDYYALVRGGKTGLRATLFRDRKDKPDYKVTELNLSRSSLKSVKVTVPLKKLEVGSSRATYNWYAQTIFSGKSCPKVCFDWAPDVGKDGGGIAEPLPLSL